VAESSLSNAPATVFSLESPAYVRFDFHMIKLNPSEVASFHVELAQLVNGSYFEVASRDYGLGGASHASASTYATIDSSWPKLLQPGDYQITFSKIDNLEVTSSVYNVSIQK